MSSNIIVTVCILYISVIQTLWRFRYFRWLQSRFGSAKSLKIKHLEYMRFSPSDTDIEGHTHEDIRQTKLLKVMRVMCSPVTSARQCIQVHIRQTKGQYVGDMANRIHSRQL